MCISKINLCCCCFFSKLKKAWTEFAHSKSNIRTENHVGLSDDFPVPQKKIICSDLRPLQELHVLLLFITKHGSKGQMTDEEETRQIYDVWLWGRSTASWSRGKKLGWGSQWGEGGGVFVKLWVCDIVWGKKKNRKSPRSPNTKEQCMRPLTVHHTGLSGPIQTSSQQRFCSSGPEAGSPWWAHHWAPSCVCAPPALYTAPPG